VGAGAGIILLIVAAIPFMQMLTKPKVVKSSSVDSESGEMTYLGTCDALYTLNSVSSVSLYNASIQFAQNWNGPEPNPEI
jgi:hypothetical protein